MEDLFEILVPLVIAAIYFFGNMRSKKESPPPGQRPKRSRRPQTEAELAMEARQREAQEAIRRKILERRGGANKPRQSMPSAELVIPEEKELRQPAAPIPEARQPTFEVPKLGSFSWGDSGDAYELQMEEQQRRIEETRRQAEAIRQQAGQQTGRGSASAAGQTRARQSRKRYHGSVRSRFNSPSAARSAIIYAEVLGRPLGLDGRSRLPSD